MITCKYEKINRKRERGLTWETRGLFISTVKAFVAISAPPKITRGRSKFIQKKEKKNKTIINTGIQTITRYASKLRKNQTKIIMAEKNPNRIYKL